MIVSKNSFGHGMTMSARTAKAAILKNFGGSSLDRKEKVKKKKEKVVSVELKEQIDINEMKPKERRSRTLSSRSKSKIRKKIIALSRITDKLSFVTLTFVNQVDDDLAVKILRKFLDNVKKMEQRREKDFEYLWVAERQTKNKIFKNNIHFHLVTNKYFERERWRKYWFDVQESFGIVPRNETGKIPSSTLDVRGVKGTNFNKIISYITKYVTKNESEFNCQVWNCSKGISKLYTCFYRGFEFIQEIEKLSEDKSTGVTLKVKQKDYCTVYSYTINETTSKLYEPLDEINKRIWNNYSNSK